MHLSRKITLFAAGLCAVLDCAVAALEADEADPARSQSIADEFRAAVTDMESTSAGTEKKHDAYTRLARMLYLSGDTESAAAAWENAAYANPEKRDDTALVESAACYVSIGDWDKADAIVKLLLLTSRDDKNISARAVFLNGQIEILHNGNPAPLASAAENPEYLSFRPAVYYMLWHFNGDNDYRTKLLTEFPDSPEAYSAASAAGKDKFVSVPETAHWLLFPGREEFHTIPQKDERTNTVQAEAPKRSAATARAAPVKASRPLQTGLYREKENAALQAKRLEAEGFNAALAPRVVDGNSYWAVSVGIPEGATEKITIARLKEHGFDAFPALP
ncbi:MAG: hypothetical protein LBD86_00310 [Spirochaetaceae bacterium]|jgi:tetratricopeptide (TPR) repeat protein|nr:hypothetical protein [Spirochaetaceae bacterium]